MNRNNPSMYPLRFQPIFRRYLWGGRRLATHLHKRIGSQPAAESWEIVDHRDVQSVVLQGPLAGKSLHQLIAEFGPQLVGKSVFEKISRPELPPNLHQRFPLLFKFLDAHQPLSIQVHPDDRFAATLDPPDLGKTEAWFVMHADPGSKIFCGLKTGVSKSDFAAAVTQCETESLLHNFEPKIGDCLFIPPGTVHAIGSGLVVAEIQQASDATFRVFDWNRFDAEGNARPLHIEHALAATNFSRGPVNPIRISNGSADTSTLVACDKFVLNQSFIVQPTTMGGDGKFHIIAVLEGELAIDSDINPQPLRGGETILLPASMPAFKLNPGDGGAKFLKIHIE